MQHDDSGKDLVVVIADGQPDWCTDRYTGTSWIRIYLHHFRVLAAWRSYVASSMPNVWE